MDTASLGVDRGPLKSGAPFSNFEQNPKISDLEIRDLAVVGPQDRSGMVFGLTWEGLGRPRTILHAPESNS